MSHYAKITNDIVTQLIVAEKDFIDILKKEYPNDEWIQTSYNTHGGVHALGGKPLRKNYAGVGYTYNREMDAFIPPKPNENAILCEETCLWNDYPPYPNDGKDYIFDVDTLKWSDSLK